MPDLCLNARFLLWKKGVARAGWASRLAALIGWSDVAGAAFLSGESGALSEKELRVVARFGGVTEGDLASKDLLVAANLDLFHENLAFLVDLLPHGEKKRFAVKLGVDATTISRWKNGAQHPTKKKTLMILRYFLLPEDTDLRVAPVFLSATPVGAGEMRDWLHGQIDALSAESLRDLLPALRMLLVKR